MDRELFRHLTSNYNSTHDELEKQAATRFIKQFGSSLWNRLGSSFKGVKPDYQRMTGLFSKDPNALRRADLHGTALGNLSGGLTQPFSPSMASSAQRANKMLSHGYQQTEFDDILKRSLDYDTGFKRFTGKFSDPDAVWVAQMRKKFGDESIDALRAARVKAIQGDSMGAQRHFMENAFTKNFRPDTVGDLSSGIGRYGMAGWHPDGTAWSKSDWVAHKLGHGIGNVAGPLGVYAPLTFVPWTLAEWGGAATAAPSATHHASRGAMDGAADRVHAINSQPMWERFKTAWDPNRNLADMYYSDPQGAGAAYNTMFGPGRYANIPTPGLGAMFSNLANPLFGRNFVEEMVNAKGQQAMQKMGSMDKEGRQFIKDRATSAYRALENFLGRINRATGPHVEDAAASAARGTKLQKYEPLTATSRWDAFKQQVKNPENRGALVASGLGLGMIGLGAKGGYDAVRDGAYRHGYNAAQAATSQAYSQMPFLKRFGAAVSPTFTEHVIKKQYPGLYETYRNRHLPAGMRG